MAKLHSVFTPRTSTSDCVQPSRLTTFVCLHRHETYQVSNEVRRFFRKCLAVWFIKAKKNVLLSPVSEFWAQGKVVCKEVLLGWYGSLQPEECVVLYAGLPQVLTGPVVHHVETQQCFPGFALFKEEGIRDRHSVDDVCINQLTVTQ